MALRLVVIVVVAMNKQVRTSLAAGLWIGKKGHGISQAGVEIAAQVKVRSGCFDVGLSRVGTDVGCA